MRHIVESIPGFKLLKVVGRGAQGIVCKVLEESTSRTVALKFARHGLLATPDDRSRFKREIKHQARLDHPHIATILSAGVTSEGYAWFTSQFIEGDPLDAWLANRARVLDIDGRWDLSVFTEVCRAVHYLHEQGIIHRDLKPSNIIVDRDDVPYVIDFGLAKAVEPSDLTSLTHEGMMVGTPQFASPEQLLGMQAGRTSDVYSLGVILYDWIVGRPPYDCDTEDRSAVIQAITQGKVVRPDHFAPGIDFSLQTILMNCLERDPKLRYQSAEELAEDIEHYQRREAVASHRGSMIMRVRKVMGHNRLRLVAASLVAACCVGWLATGGEATPKPASFRSVNGRVPGRGTLGTSNLAALDGSVDRLVQSLLHRDLEVDTIPTTTHPERVTAVTQERVAGWDELYAFQGKLVKSVDEALEADDLERSLAYSRTMVKIAVDLDKSSNLSASGGSYMYWRNYADAVDRILEATPDEPLPELLDTLHGLGDMVPNSVAGLQECVHRLKYLIDVCTIDGELDSEQFQDHYNFRFHQFPLFMAWPSPEEAKQFVDDFFAAWVAHRKINKRFDRTPWMAYPTYYLIYYSLPSEQKKTREFRAQLLADRRRQIIELERRAALPTEQ